MTVSAPTSTPLSISPPRDYSAELDALVRMVALPGMRVASAVSPEVVDVLTIRLTPGDIDRNAMLLSDAITAAGMIVAWYPASEALAGEDRYSVNALKLALFGYAPIFFGGNTIEAFVIRGDLSSAPAVNMERDPGSSPTSLLWNPQPGDTGPSEPGESVSRDLQLRREEDQPRGWPMDPPPRGDGVPLGLPGDGPSGAGPASLSLGEILEMDRNRTASMAGWCCGKFISFVGFCPDHGQPGPVCLDPADQSFLAMRRADPLPAPSPLSSLPTSPPSESAPSTAPGQSYPNAGERIEPAEEHNVVNPPRQNLDGQGVAPYDPIQETVPKGLKP